MSKKHQYLITLLRTDGSRDFFVPSLAQPGNASIVTASEFAITTLSDLLLSTELELDFISNPDAFGILGITCDVPTAEFIQAHSSQVASVVNIHQPCTTDPWDLLLSIPDHDTRKAFAELRNERRFQNDVASDWAYLNRGYLRDFCADLITPASNDTLFFNLPAIGRYLGLSDIELSQFMIIAPERLHSDFPNSNTSLRVINRARALVLVAYMLRTLFGTNGRATSWMLRAQPEGWHYDNLSAKDCVLNGYYTQVINHLKEVTRSPKQ